MFLEKPSPHLLVIDDDRRLRGLLDKYLSDNGFHVTTAESAAEGRACLKETTFALIILDLMMPDESGLEFMVALRADLTNPDHNIPILMLTAMGDPEHRIAGLEAGADDYLSKPFEPRELLLRIQKILARIHGGTTALLHLGELTYDTDKAVLLKDEQMIPLTSLEIALLNIFAQNPGVTLSRERLAELGGVTLSPRTVDVQITRLRRKIEPDPKNPTFLQTVRHQGYVLRSTGAYPPKTSVGGGLQ